jgi:SAM-dependent methyltransferase
MSRSDRTVVHEPELFTQQTSCWICNGAEFKPVNRERFDFENLKSDARVYSVLGLYDQREFELRQCRACSFIQPSVLPSHPSYFDTLYDLNWPDTWMETEFVCGYKDRIFQTVLAHLKSRLGSTMNRRLLDVGTHVGRMLALAQQDGWTAEGIELNPKTAAFAAARTKLPVHRKSAQELAESGERYDAVTLTDVLEHIPQPLPILKSLRPLIRPGGWIAIKVPFGRSQLFKQRLRGRFSRTHQPEISPCLVHVNHFSPQSLTKALKLAGYESIEMDVGAPEMGTDRRFKSTLSNTFRIATYHLARILPGGKSSPLAMNIQAYARNPASA